MRNFILAAAAVLATAIWLNSADGQRAKRHLLETNNNQTQLITED